MNPEAQKFLENLTEDDVLRIKKALKTYVFVETLGWFLRWVTLGLVVLVVSIAQFGDSIGRLKDWLK